MYNVLEEIRNILVYVDKIDKKLDKGDQADIKFYLDMIRERAKIMVDRINEDQKHDQTRIKYIYELLGE